MLLVRRAGGDRGGAAGPVHLGDLLGEGAGGAGGARDVGYAGGVRQAGRGGGTAGTHHGQRGGNRVLHAHGGQGGSEAGRRYCGWGRGVARAHQRKGHDAVRGAGARREAREVWWGREAGGEGGGGGGDDRGAAGGWGAERTEGGSGEGDRAPGVLEAQGDDALPARGRGRSSVSVRGDRG